MSYVLAAPRAPDGGWCLIAVGDVAAMNELADHLDSDCSRGFGVFTHAEYSAMLSLDLARRAYRDAYCGTAAAQAERDQTAQAELDEIRQAIDDLLATMPLARAILWCMAVIDKAVSRWTRRRG